MAGVENVVVEWAPFDPPITLPDEPNWQTLPDCQTIHTKGGQEITDVTQMFNAGTAEIKVRNGDTAGGTPQFDAAGTSYRGVNIRVNVTGIGVLWRGRIDRVEFDMTKTPFAGFVTLHCVDTIGNVSDAAVPDDLFPLTVDYFTQVTTMSDAFVRVMTQLQPDAVISVSGDFSHQLVKAPDKFENRQGLLDFLNQVLLTEGATMYVSAVGDMVLRGRWKHLELLSAGAPTPVVFTDTAPDGVTTFAYRRDDLEWADAGDDYVNSVQTRSKYLDQTVTVEDVATGYPRVQLSRTELVTIRQGWVEANARMWFTVQNQQWGYPKKLKFLVATPGRFLPTIYTASLAPDLSAERQYQILHTQPGQTEQVTYRVVPEFVEHDINNSRWICGIGFSSLNRWWFGYGNGTDPIELVEIDGDAEHGIDSLAIIAP